MMENHAKGVDSEVMADAHLIRIEGSSYDLFETKTTLFPIHVSSLKTVRININRCAGNIIWLLRMSDSN
jgi:hypothetical protein